MLLKSKNDKAFTIIELLVVIGIILVVAAMTLPTTIDFMKKSRLKGAASMIKMACLQARSQAIAQRERQFVVLYTETDAEPNSVQTISRTLFAAGLSEDQTGRINTIQVFDSNENSNRDFESRTQAEELPESISIQKMGDSATFSSLLLEFSPTGSVKVLQGYTNDFPNGSDEVFADNKADIVLQQNNGEHIAVIDVIKNTGLVHFEIRTP